MGPTHSSISEVAPRTCIFHIRRRGVIEPCKVTQHARCVHYVASYMACAHVQTAAGILCFILSKMSNYTGDEKALCPPFLRSRRLRKGEDRMDG